MPDTPRSIIQISLVAFTCSGILVIILPVEVRNETVQSLVAGLTSTEKGTVRYPAWVVDKGTLLLVVG